jgi:hypothetical protein
MRRLESIEDSDGGVVRTNTVVGTLAFVRGSLHAPLCGANSHHAAQL